LGSHRAGLVQLLLKHGKGTIQVGLGSSANREQVVRAVDASQQCAEKGALKRGIQQKREDAVIETWERQPC
jgi:hypothetical protein